MKVFIDGAVENNMRYNSSNTYGGIGIFFKNGDKKNTAEPFYRFPITNNRCEIYAAIKSIDLIMKEKLDKKNMKKDYVVIHTDSEYLLKGITIWIDKWKKNKWKTIDGKDVKNKDLFYELDHILNAYKRWLKVEFKFVKSHLELKDIKKYGITKEEWYGNMMADKLAHEGRKIAKYLNK